MKKSLANLLRSKVGVEENKNEPPPFPLLTGAMFPNCFVPVFKGLGGLSVALSVPAKNIRDTEGERRFTFLCRSF